MTPLSADSPFTGVVTRLGCLRGVSTLTAFGLAVEIGDWQRLSGRTIGAYLGPVPTEYSSGAARTQGGLTRTGNTMRAGIDRAAWHHRAPYRPGVVMRRRWDAASPSARARGQSGNRRLALEQAREVVRQRAPLQRRAKDELAGMQDEGLALLRLDQRGEVVLAYRGVDVGVPRVVEDPEQVVQPDVDAGGLDQAVVEGVDAQPPRGDFGADVAIGEQHPTSLTVGVLTFVVTSSAGYADVVQWQNISFPS